MVGIPQTNKQGQTNDNRTITSTKRTNVRNKR